MEELKSKIFTFVLFGAMLCIGIASIISSRYVARSKETTNSMAMVIEGNTDTSSSNATASNETSSGQQTVNARESAVTADQTSSGQQTVNARYGNETTGTPSSNSSSNQHPDKPPATTEVQREQANNYLTPLPTPIHSSDCDADPELCTTHNYTENTNAPPAPTTVPQENVPTPYPTEPSTQFCQANPEACTSQHYRDQTNAPSAPSPMPKLESFSTSESNNIGGTSFGGRNNQIKPTPGYYDLFAVPTSAPTNLYTAGAPCSREGGRAENGKFICEHLVMGGTQWVEVNSDLQHKLNITKADLLSGATDAYQRYLLRNDGYIQQFNNPASSVSDKAVIALAQGGDFVSQLWNSTTNRFTGGEQTNTFEEYVNSEVETSKKYAESGMKRPDCIANPISLDCGQALVQTAAVAPLGAMESLPVVGPIAEAPLNWAIDRVYETNPQERRSAHAATEIGSEDLKIMTTLDVGGNVLDGAGESIAQKAGDTALGKGGTVLSKVGEAMQRVSPLEWPFVGGKIEGFVNDAPVSNAIVRTVQSHISLPDKAVRILSYMTDVSQLKTPTKIFANKVGYRIDQAAGTSKIGNVLNGAYDFNEFIGNNVFLKEIKAGLFEGAAKTNAGHKSVK